jgi:hypothetical protein
MAYSAVFEFGDNSTQRYSKQFLLANFRLGLGYQSAQHRDYQTA